MVTTSKVVTGSDRRIWTVRRRLEWKLPATGEGLNQEFEHDVDGGRTAAAVILILLAMFWVALLSWMPSEVHVPWWLVIAGLALVAFFPIRWVLRRPWTLVAQTPGRDDLDPEHWVGTVRGVAKAREETAIVIRNIQIRASPAHTDGPLQPVT